MCVCYRGPPSGQEQKREEQEGKTPHPVEPRPSLAPTGSAAEPPVKQRLGQSVLKCDRGGTKETETPEPDSVRHNLSHRRTTRRAAASVGCFHHWKLCRRILGLVRHAVSTISASAPPPEIRRGGHRLCRSFGIIELNELLVRACQFCLTTHAAIRKTFPAFPKSFIETCIHKSKQRI